MGDDGVLQQSPWKFPKRDTSNQMMRVMGPIICTSFDSCETHCMNFFAPWITK